MRLIQYFKDGQRHVGWVQPDGDHAREVGQVSSVFELANLAISRKKQIADLVKEMATDKIVDYADLLAKGQVLAPVEHPEPARYFITGTGLTHIGSASARNKMHVDTHGDGAPESDSMKIFRMGLSGGKP